MSRDAELAATTRQELENVIRRGLARDYTSQSCQDAIETSNHYQSVRLGDDLTEGFRSPRFDILDGIAFAGRSVLDLGSNLGEMSRAARDRGAVLVDGFEYDAYFVEMANLINAYNRATRVSFYERDITSGDSYDDTYDIVMAWSVFVYIRPVMDVIAKITREIFILETHFLDDNLESYYMQWIRPHFPAYVKLRDTEWGQPEGHQSRIRSVFAFARDDPTLSAIVSR